MSSISEEEYEARAQPELKALVSALDALELPGLECELASDILTVELEDGGRYVVNSHRAARQIWMAAERSAWHFDWDADKAAWIAKKSGDELWAALSKALSQKFKQPVRLERQAG